MAVIGSLCCACGMPVEHDHYVPTGAQNMHEIYRGSSSSSVVPVIEFGPDHEWLKHAIILPRDKRNGKKPEKGFVEDGRLCNETGNHFSALIGDVYSAFMHVECWNLASKPESFFDFAIPYWSYEWKFLEKYMGQLFDFSALKLDSKDWMLLNPSGEAELAKRNRERIQQLIQDGREYHKSYIGVTPGRIDEFLKINCWDGGSNPQGFWRYRKLLRPEIDVSGYDHGICAFYDYKDPLSPPKGAENVALEEFLKSLYKGIESSGKGIHHNLCLDDGTLKIYYYAKDLDFCTKFIQEQSQKCFGRETEVAITFDPGWKLFWEHFFPVNQSIEMQRRST